MTLQRAVNYQNDPIESSQLSERPYREQLPIALSSHDPAVLHVDVSSCFNTTLRRLLLHGICGHIPIAFQLVEKERQNRILQTKQRSSLDMVQSALTIKLVMTCA